MPSTRDADIDLDDLNSSRTLAVLAVRPGSRVLCIDAADGSVAAALVERGCRVWAIEKDEGAAGLAGRACEQVAVGDIETLDLGAATRGERFDVVLMVGALERVREPLALLRRSSALLAPGGQIVASLSNVAHGALRLSLLRGRFAYVGTDPLGRDRLRFFDRPAIEALFGSARLDIRERLRVTRGLADTEIPVDIGAFPAQVVSEVTADAESATYEFVIVATPREGLAATRPVASLAERLQERLGAVEGVLRAAEARMLSLDEGMAASARLLAGERERVAALGCEISDSQCRLDELSSELSTRMRDLQRKDLELRHLRSDLAVKEAFLSDLRQTVAEGEERLSVLPRALAERDERLSRQEHMLSQQDQTLSQQALILSAPSVRLVTSLSARLHRLPLLRQALRRATRLASRVLAGPSG